MPLYEIFIPAASADGFNITARIQADTWINALRHGLARLGDTADVRNILCDIHENGIDVTEQQSGRVFRLRELPDTQTTPVAKPTDPVQTAGATVLPLLATLPPPPPPAATPPPVATWQTATPAKPVPPPAPVVAEPVTQKPVSKDAAAPVVVHSGSSEVKIGKPRFVSTANEESFIREPASAEMPVLAIGRSPAPEDERGIDDIIAELFEETQHLYQQPDLAEAAKFVLDLALRTVHSEAGAVFIADINHDDLYFIAACGAPETQHNKGTRVPMGQGIVGFCAQEGVALAVSDVQKDPRFQDTVSEGIGSNTRSVLCAPAQRKGRILGAIELLNRKDGSSYQRQEVDLLNYLAHTFAEYIIQAGQVGV